MREKQTGGRKTGQVRESERRDEGDGQIKRTNGRKEDRKWKYTLDERGEVKGEGDLIARERKDL